LYTSKIDKIKETKQNKTKQNNKKPKTKKKANNTNKQTQINMKHTQHKTARITMTLSQDFLVQKGIQVRESWSQNMKLLLHPNVVANFRFVEDEGFENSLAVVFPLSKVKYTAERLLWLEQLKLALIQCLKFVVDFGDKIGVRKWNLNQSKNKK
jgi:hypothetical protein